MAVRYCAQCQSDPDAKRRYGRHGLADGADCPLCHQPACRFHLTTVRWRWLESGERDAALICRECQRSYRHRHWDVAAREWIT